jgi:hypothetical protein
VSTIAALEEENARLAFNLGHAQARVRELVVTVNDLRADLREQKSYDAEKYALVQHCELTFLYNRIDEQRRIILSHMEGLNREKFKDK